MANGLVKALHQRLLPVEGQDELFGATWDMLQAKQEIRGPKKL